MARLAALPDNDAAAFVRRLDAALREAQPGEGDIELAEVVFIAASARAQLRHRRAAAASVRAKDIVHRLIDSTETSE